MYFHLSGAQVRELYGLFIGSNTCNVNVVMYMVEVSWAHDENYYQRQTI